MSKSKDTGIFFRIKETKKQKWKEICSSKKTTMTDLIIASVDNTILDSEKREIRKFIEKQDNIFLKIENNINQFARYANTKKTIDAQDLKAFTNALDVIAKLKKEQNNLFLKIFSMLAKDISKC